MKFAEHLAAHLTPEWTSQYIRYEEMKDILYALEQDAPIDDEAAFKRYCAKVDEQFFQRCDQELAKINTFFAEKLAEAQRKYEALKSEIKVDYRKGDKATAVGLLGSSNLAISSVDNDAGGVTSAAAQADENNQTFTRRLLEKTRERQNKKRQFKKIHDLKLAYSEFYLSLILLQNYQSLNFTGFRKILKKHDKLFKTETGNDWRKANVEIAPFYTTKKVDNMISETENQFTQHLEGGNRQRAMKRLRVPPFEEKQNPWTTFRLGLFSGMLSVLCTSLVCIVILSLKNHKLPFNWKVALKFYRGLLFLITHVFFIGLNTYGWSSSGVNHVLIFEIDPRNHLVYQELLEIGTFLGVLWMLNVIGFIICAQFSIEHSFFPIIFIIFLIIYLTNPLRVMKQSARFWLIKIFWRVFSAPFHKVQFADFWLADQFTSFEFIFTDVQFIVCYYLMEANWAPFRRDNFTPCTPTDTRDLTNVFNIVTLLVSCLPAYIRFTQCLRRYRDTKNKFPHLANALKYATFFFDTLALILRYSFSKRYDNEWENPYFYIWIFVRCVSTSYKLWWDLKMDWGFFDKNAGENKFLREVCIYSSKGYYYFAIVQDVLLRFIWIVRLYDLNMGRTGKETYKELVVTILAFLEVFRRFVWNFFRLENEHLNNCGQFRAVRDISISPLKPTDIATIEKMMDEEDGITNRQQMNSHNKNSSSGGNANHIVKRNSTFRNLLRLDDSNHNTINSANHINLNNMNDRIP